MNLRSHLIVQKYKSDKTDFWYLQALEYKGNIAVFLTYVNCILAF